MRIKWSDEKLAEFAEKCRKALNISLWQKFDVLSFIRGLENASNPNVKIKFVPVSSGYMRGALAKAEPKFRTVNYVQGLMDRLISGDWTAAAIFLEEIGHIFLHPEADVRNHSIGEDHRAKVIPEIREQEEEVEKFVWYLLAPISEVYSETNPQRLAEKFGMTLESANDYCAHIAETRNKTERRTRTLPPNVIDLVARKKPRITTVTKVAVPSPLSKRNKPNNVQLELPLAGPSGGWANGFLDETCGNCGRSTVRKVGGCKQCLCGEEYGCN